MELDGLIMTGTTHIMGSEAITIHGILLGTMVYIHGTIHTAMVSDTATHLTIMGMEFTPLRKLFITAHEMGYLQTLQAQ